MTKSLEKFGQDLTTKVRTTDLNGDGYDDRIIESCDGGTAGSCVAVQVEMGLSDGSYIPVYKEDPEYNPLESDVLYLGPQFFADMADGAKTGFEAIAEPGAAAGKALSDGPVQDDYDLMRMCFENDGASDIVKCVKQARDYPAEHVFQSPALFREEAVRLRPDWQGVEAKSASDMRLDYEGSMQVTGQDPEDLDHNSWQNVVGAELIVSESALAIPLHELYSPFEIPQNPTSRTAHYRRHKLRQNVILDVKASRSEDLREYFYAHTLGEIGDAELASAVVRLHEKAIVSDAKIKRSDMLGIMGLEGEVAELFASDPDNMVSADMVLKKIIRAKVDEELKAAYRGLVMSIVAEIKKHPGLVDEFSMLINAVDDIALSHPEVEQTLKELKDEKEEGEKEIIFSDVLPLDEAEEKDPEAGSWKIPVKKEYATYGTTKKIFGNGATEETLREDPDILRLLPGLGERLIDGLGLEIELLANYPSISKAWEEARMIKIGSSLSSSELASLSGKADFISKISRQDPWATVERIALKDEALMASITKDEVAGVAEVLASIELPDDPEFLLNMLENGISNPALMIGSIDPLLDEDEAIKRKVEKVKMDWLMVRLVAKKLSGVAPGRFVEWAFALKRDVEKGRQVDLQSFKAVMDLSMGVMAGDVKPVLDHYTRLAFETVETADGVTKVVDKKRIAEEIAPVIKTLLSNAKHPSQLPDPVTIVRLGRRHPALRAAALIALGKKGEANGEVKDFIRESIRDRRMTAEIRSASANAALLLGDEEAVPYLANLIKHEDFRVRYAAVEALKLRAVPSEPASDIEGPPVQMASLDEPVRLAQREKPDFKVVDIMKDAVLDSDARIAFTASTALMSWGVPDVARILAGKLERYREDMKKIRGAREDDPYAVSTELSYANFLGIQERLEEGYALNTPLVPSGAQRMKEEDLPTLKRFTLQAIATFGQPRSSFPMLAEMLEEDQGEIELGMTAQALVSLSHTKGLRLIYDRLEKKSPESLIAYAAGITVELGRRGVDISEFTPRLVHYLHHQNEKVRELVAKSLNALKDERALAFIIESSYETDTTIRLRMAEALPYFDCAESAERTIELTEDEDERVRVVALTSLDKYKTEGALAVIRSHLNGGATDEAVDEPA